MPNDDLQDFLTTALGEIETNQRRIINGIGALQDRIDAIETRIEDMQPKIDNIYFKVK